MPRRLFALTAAWSFAALLVAVAPCARATDDSLVPLMPDSSGFYNVQFRTQADGQPLAIPCRLFLPRGYEKTKDPAPLLVFLHGEDERGTDLAALLTVGPEKRLREDQTFRDGTRFIVLSPQCPPNRKWDEPAVSQAVLALVKDIGTRFRVDADRVAITGAGMGATGSLHVAALDADRFAAVAAVAMKSVVPETVTKALRHVATYVVSPQNEQPTFESYNRTAEALGKAHSEPQVRVTGDNTRNCTAWFYTDNGNYDWILQKKRRTAAEKKQREDLNAKETTDFIASLPKTPGTYKLRYFGWGGDKKQDIPFELIIPTGYTDKNGPWPSIVFLCGAGETGMDLSGVDLNGPGVKLRDDAAFRAWFPFIMIEPIHDNSPERCRAVTQLVRELEKSIRIDPDRVYVTGLSLGGTSTWVTATAAPDLFAAAIPINGRERCNEIAAKALKYLTTWIIVGGDDGDFFKGSVNMQALLVAAGDDTHLTVIPHEGHGSWPRYYNDRRFYDWLLQHRRLSPEARAMRDKFPTTAPSDMLAHIDKHPELLEPGTHWLSYRTQLGGQPYEMRYSLYLPKSYTAGNDRLPMTVYLHADEHRSTDQALIFEWGSGVDPRKDEAARVKFPMIGLVPQLPNDKQWTDAEVLKMTLGLIDEVSKHVRVDTDRVYATGMQNGANGVWSLALLEPNRFAAVAPLWGGVVQPDEVAKKLRYVAARVMTPAGDAGAINAARQMVDALRKARAEVRLAFVPPQQDPASWVPYYTDPELTSWLISHRRISESDRKERESREALEAVAKLPTAPGDHPLHFETMVDGKLIAMTYRVWLPTNYDKTAEKYPLLAYLHGTNMPATQPADGMWGPDLNLRGNDKQAATFALIGIFPQLPAGRKWDEPAIIKATAALINNAVLKFRVDPDRVYASGVGAGGSGACRVAMEAPDLFAAVATCAPSLKADEIGVQLRGMPTWVVGPADDLLAADAAKKLADAIQKTQTEVQLTQLEGQGNKPWLGFYENPTTYEWLLRHRRQR